MAEAPQFSYKQSAPTDGGNGSKPPPLTDEERKQLQEKLKETQSEIATLRIVLQTREKEAQELKRRLGFSPWQELADDVNQGLAKMKESDAYHRTNEILQTAGDKVSSTFGQLKNSTVFRTFESKVGGAYSSVKSKMTPSSSVNFGATSGTTPASNVSAPATPMTDKPQQPSK